MKNRKFQSLARFGRSFPRCYLQQEQSQQAGEIVGQNEELK